MKNKFGILGILTGGLGLMLAIIHFWAGPFSPQPSLETVVADKAVSIRKAAADVLAGKKVESAPVKNKLNADRIVSIFTGILGGLAFIFAVISFVKHESTRSAAGAAALGIGAIVFQFVVMYLMAVLIVILIVGALLSFAGVS